MRRYSALARRAWDPAARNLAVETAPTTKREGFVADNNSPLVAARIDDKLPRATGKTGGDQVSAAQKEIIRPPVQDMIDTRPLDRVAAERRTEQRAKMLSQMPPGKRTDASDSLTVIPHQRTDAEWAEIGRLVLERKWLSETDQYVHRYILGFESLSPDTQGNSRGGIQQNLLDEDQELLMLLNAFRREEGKPEIAQGTSLQTLSSSDLLDIQRVYLANALDPFNSKDKDIDAWLDETVQNGSFLASWGSPEPASQIADAVFQHGTETGPRLIQWAANSLLSSMSADERQRLGLPAQIKVDGIVGSISQTIIKTLGNDPRWADLFLRAIRERRTAYTRQADAVGHGQAFEGATMNRIWGIWTP